eukprot:1215124-Amorphochlora_amoeboformis.AAC.2
MNSKGGTRPCMNSRYIWSTLASMGRWSSGAERLSVREKNADWILRSIDRFSLSTYRPRASGRATIPFS